MAEEPQALRTHPHPTHHGAGTVGACGQDQPRDSRSPASRPMLKHCKSCRRKFLTHTVEKKSIPFCSSSARPVHLVWVFLFSLSQCTGKITFVVERGRSTSTRSPLSADVLQASRRQQRNHANTSVFSRCCAAAGARGKLGRGWRGGGKPSGRVVGMAGAGHRAAVRAQGAGWSCCVCCRDVFGQHLSTCDFLPTPSSNPTQPQPNTTPTQPQANASLPLLHTTAHHDMVWILACFSKSWKTVRSTRDDTN